MKLIHTADLHLGQIIYRHYERADEHACFFDQLSDYIENLNPDLLIVSGDVFDVPQPSAETWKFFNNEFVGLRRRFPGLHIVIVAGNHDSASRLQSHSELWDLAGVSLVGSAPPLAGDSEWEEKYIVRIPRKGYVIALPYFSSDRSKAIAELQEYVAKENSAGLPVVMTGHLAVTGCDLEGHDPDIGNLRSMDLYKLGDGYDYLALGHIHKPQTLGYPGERFDERVSHPSPVARYSGSPIHISADENYPHSISLIEIPARGADVEIRLLPIRQLRHFITLPCDRKDSFASEKDIFKDLKNFIKKNDGCYIRFRINSDTMLSPDFNTKVYDAIEESGKDIRYNPKAIRVQSPLEEEGDEEGTGIEIEVSTLQQMTDPLEFLRLTADQYPGLDIDTLENAFLQIEVELKRMEEKNPATERRKK